MRLPCEHNVRHKRVKNGDDPWSCGYQSASTSNTLHANLYIAMYIVRCICMNSYWYMQVYKWMCSIFSKHLVRLCGNVLLFAPVEITVNNYLLKTKKALMACKHWLIVNHLMAYKAPLHILCYKWRNNEFYLYLNKIIEWGQVCPKYSYLLQSSSGIIMPTTTIQTRIERDENKKVLKKRVQ